MTESDTQRHRGIYLLPNLFTTAGLFAGFYSIVAGINGHYVPAAIAVIAAAILDGIDGRVARLTNTQSDFGVQYDSLADLISFGLAPSLLMFNWSLSSLSEYGPLFGKLGWLAAFIYTACAALRLARFNTQAEVQDKRYFQGLASPAAAGMMVTSVWFFTDIAVLGSTVAPGMLIMTTVIGLLMFSQFRYLSFKVSPRGERISILWVFVLVLILALVAVDPPKVLMVIGVVYVISGPVLTLVGIQRRRSERRARQSDSGD